MLGDYIVLFDLFFSPFMLLFLSELNCKDWCLKGDTILKLLTLKKTKTMHHKGLNAYICK